ncbi:MAG: DUF4258 domain-containing protein [Phycisphaeraceae bacterium]|nr:DUF4258 domain-containing protein [Phycisphaeraceae bacterium]
MSKQRPPWWEWEIELSPHVLKRMVDRGFSETDLRAMLGRDGIALRPSNHEGRWIVTTGLDDEPWEVVLEPDSAVRLTVVVTAYALE